MKKDKLRIKKNYDCKFKNEIRQIIVDEIRKRNINSILSLESPEFLFSKLLPDKKIIVFEKEADIIKKMEKKCPKNVDLIFGNISKFGILNSKADMIYLDFCGTWMTEQENIIKLKEAISKTKLLAITLCLRQSKTHFDRDENFHFDHQFELVNKLQSLLDINFKVIYGKSYYDSVQMVTIILENPEVRE